MRKFCVYKKFLSSTRPASIFISSLHKRQWHCTLVQSCCWRIPYGYANTNASCMSSLAILRNSLYLSAAYFTTCRGLSSHRSFKRKRQQVKEHVQETKKVMQEFVGDVKREGIYTIPNLLTASRIVLAPVIGYCVMTEHFAWACGIFLYAGITDVIDGWIARHVPGQASFIGSFLDPLADKLLVSVLYITLTAVHLIPVPLTLLIIARDIGLIGAAFYVRYISIPRPVTVTKFFDLTLPTAQLKPLFISKLNTLVQLSLVAATLAAPIWGFVDHSLLHIMWYGTAATTVTSGLSYLLAKDTFKVLAEQKSSRLRRKKNSS